MILNVAALNKDKHVAGYANWWTRFSDEKNARGPDNEAV